MRELMAQHRDKPACFACHGILDPLGFALENFDAVGSTATKDRIAGTAIDASGVLPDGTKIDGPDDLRNALASNPEPVRADPDREADDLRDWPRGRAITTCRRSARSCATAPRTTTGSQRS